ncbi:TPA: hypothetical protein N0F65_008250 [Lagenidium giganteum]|uniref:Uncharacterized protein n=1 Tax=Lagenidium giganteum TaxID=4803 RepID=A0AAV2YJZ5_9STRA|nr:TPA: hypothetical protein N0F65_008250 [Lagenidium giganteum]
MTPLESYIHLGTDFDERRQTILALREDKLATTRSFLEHKARGLNPELPYNYTDTFERFGKMYSVSFQLMKFTNISLGDVVDIVLEEHLGRDEELAKMIGCLSVREPYDCVHKSFLHQRVTTSLEWMGKLDDSSPVMDSNSLLYSSKHGNDSAIIAIDYIDQDDLHPYVSKDRIRKDATSG